MYLAWRNWAMDPYRFASSSQESAVYNKKICKIVPDSDVNVNYGPNEPPAEDSKVWAYDQAKRLRQLWFAE